MGHCGEPLELRIIALIEKPHYFDCSITKGCLEIMRFPSVVKYLNTVEPEISVSIKV